MRMMMKMKNYVMLWSCCLMLTACVEDFIGEGGGPACATTLQPNAQFSDLLERYSGELTYIDEELSFVAYVVSSDAEGNHFGSLYVQDDPTNAKYGLEIQIDLQDAYLQYPMGTELLIMAQGLYLDKKSGGYSLGKVRTVFGNDALARIPAKKAGDYLASKCGDPVLINPKKVNAGELSDSWLNMQVGIDPVQFKDAGEGIRFTEGGEDTYREVMDCEGNQVLAWISKYADFSAELLPSGSGQLRGILQKKGSAYVLHPSFREDIQMDSSPCASADDDSGESGAGEGDPGEEDPGNDDSPGNHEGNLLISEIADPDNAPEARFIELFNAGTEMINLDGWKLERYTNANTEVGSVIDLDGLVIEAGEVLVIAAEEEGFTSVFGFAPDLVGGKNSAAGSNGDDNMLLRNPEGIATDSFGRIGEDGSGTDHEFEDGRALRKSSVLAANPVFQPGEWIIHNDTGDAGTIKETKMAPEDFTPGVHQ